MCSRIGFFPNCCLLYDSWSWPLDPSHVFSVKSLLGDLVGFSDSTSSGLYEVIRSDVYPKKIESFLWELSHGAINIAGVCFISTFLNLVYYVFF